MRTSHRRDGFVLLAVLWVLMGAATLGLLLTLTSRDAQGTAANRIAFARARWRAEACVERARASVEEKVGEEGLSDSVWTKLDRLIVGVPLTSGCRLSVVPVGVTLDVNAATEEQLRRVFLTARLSPGAADSLAAGILDWRDADDDARAAGAERDWYERAGRIAPRDGDLASLAEITTVKGAEAVPHIELLLGVEPGRILLARAPPAVLAALAGMSTSVLAVVEQRRAGGDSALDLQRLVAIAPAEARDALLASLPALTALVTGTPDAWVIASEATEGQPAVTSRLEVRVVRSGRRLAILRRRSDP